MNAGAPSGRALAMLAVALFAYLTAEVFTGGAMMPMHEDLGVPARAIGSLVTGYAVIAAAAILPMAALSRWIPTQRLLVVGMAVLALSQATMAAAPNLVWIQVVRGIAAFFHGIVWAGAPVPRWPPWRCFRASRAGRWESSSWEPLSATSWELRSSPL